MPYPAFGMWDRADGSPPRVEAWGFSPTKRSMSERPLGPGSLAHRKITNPKTTVILTLILSKANGKDLRFFL